MHEFRKRSHQPQRAIDGFITAPQRPHLSSQSAGRRTGVSSDHFRSSNTRRLDDFNRPNGYHPVTRPVAQPRQATPTIQSSPQVQRPAPQQASILHMTLPGGALETDKKLRKKKNKHQKTLTKWGKIRKWSLRSGIVVAALVLLLGGFLFTKGFFKINKVFKGGGSAAALQDNVKPALLKGEGDGRINILLLGRGGDGHEGPDLTDTLLVVSIDPVNKTANMVSIPRDLWVNAGGTNTKINAVFANAKYRALSSAPKDEAAAEKAGIKAIQETTTSVLGIPLHYYGMVDFQAFQQAVDTVGGVDINIPESAAVKDYMYNEVTHKPYTLDVTAGNQHFDGLRALMFTRTRHTSARGDFDRTERQRLFISALSDKILSAGTYTNPVKISQLMSAFGDHISTDFSVSDSLRLAQIVKEVGPTNIKSLGLADPPNNFVRTGTINGLSVVIPTAGVGDYTAIQNYIRNTMKDPYLAKENAAISVFNGTTVPGLAGSMGDKLKSYGYNVATVASAPTSDYQTTTIIDVSGGKKPFTKNYLEKRLGVKATTQSPDPNLSTTGADFVVILGQDASTDSEN
jgi:LCP family protein required for cell wall assembly